MDNLLQPELWLGLFTLLVMEIVLGIDNVVFIAILSDKLPKERQALARRVGLLLAMIQRILLLLVVSWIIGLTQPLFTLLDHDVSVRDLILLAGGLFLIAKATSEIHDRLEGETGHSSARVAPSFAAVIAQIVLLDAVFSIDSVLTAVGMVREVWVMVVAVMAAVTIMLVASDRIAVFINEHPTVKMLALSFLLLIGLMLVLEGVGRHIPKGYIYFAMGFSIFVEMLNLNVKKVQRQPVQLRRPYTRSEESS